MHRRWRFSVSDKDSRNRQRSMAKLAFGRFCRSVSLTITVCLTVPMLCVFSRTSSAGWKIFPKRICNSNSHMDPTTTEILVLGAGPGGYTAAFYAADKGKKVTLVEQNPRLGGVCMNVGCIPSKALLHATAVLRESKDSAQRGIEFGALNVDLDKLRGWKESIVEKLGQGIKTLAQHRNVEVVHGRGHFEDSQPLRVETGAGHKIIRYGTGT